MSINQTIMNQYNVDNILHYFQEIANIPRKSGHEQAISNYIKYWALNLGLDVFQDEHYNLIIKKAGTEGYESHEPVILQGHMDMVCTKLESVEHDFINSPIALDVEDGILHANGTTLGADDGFAVAYGMAILVSTNIPHPPLEVVFTVEEETTFKGVKTLDYSHLQGNRLINMDGESMNEVTIGSAGGHGSTVTLPIVPVSVNNEMTKRRITIEGLQGGHSGCDIHLGRANAIYILSKVLERITVEHNIRVTEVSGGSAPNAIPLRAYADVYLHLQDVPYVQVLLQEEQEKWNTQYAKANENISISLSVVPKVDREDLVELDLEAITMERAFSNDTVQKLCELIQGIEQGILQHAPDNPNEVWYSNNIGVLGMADGAVYLKMQVRSTDAKNLEAHYTGLEKLVQDYGASANQEAEYPGWLPTFDSPLQKSYQKAYESVTGAKDLQFNVIHAGLEVGYMLDNLQGPVDAINIGPNIHDLHAPTERMQLESFVTTWNILKTFLASL
ncbi:beta-Ala-His dipeptidase [Veillonella sp. VA142]|uniref:beta-Ala-His dipeptidase n=1 Tax=Veillonella sp. VA142 TaxID=741834 RepID=UPI000F8EAA46|nr:beta-Ala-His dipeptidase [Veillonella sp. VA142]